MNKQKQYLFGIGIFAISILFFSGCGVPSPQTTQNQEFNQNNNQQKNVLNIQQLKLDMASFDRAYIPALSYTSLEKVSESTQAMQSLKTNWVTFKNKYYNINPADKAWKSDLDKIDNLIQRADQVVQSKKNIIDAHQKYLEEVRIIFKDLRKRNNINDYFIDHLTVFHEPMENIVLAGKDKTSKTFTDQDLQTIKNNLPTAIQDFQIVEKAKLDPVVFNFNSEKLKQAQQLITTEKQKLLDLQQALTTKKTDLIIKTSVAIKPNFAKLFMLFGDFNLDNNNYVIDQSDFIDSQKIISNNQATSLTQQEKDGLILMREEEKLARDVYQALGEKWGTNIFSNIARSEQTHTNAIRDLLVKYNISDPVTNDFTGSFTSSKMKALYQDLTQQGNKSLQDALIVGATIEDLDIYDLNNLLAQTKNQDIITVYNNLLKGSRNHLRAYIKQIKRNHISYSPQYISTTEFNQIIGSSQERGYSK